MQEPDDFIEPESKTKRKQHSTALQELGELLVNLSAKQLAMIPLEPLLAQAIKDARVITSHSAKRRQLQFIGRLMRKTDVEPIQAQLAQFQQAASLNKTKQHQIELWRDKLISKGDKVLEEFLVKYPAVNSQEIRQLIRNAQKDQLTHKNSGASTELFRYIRDIV